MNDACLLFKKYILFKYLCYKILTFKHKTRNFEKAFFLYKYEKQTKGTREMYVTFSTDRIKRTGYLDSEQGMLMSLQNTQSQLSQQEAGVQMELSASEQTIAEDKQEVYEAFANGEILKDDKDNLLAEYDNELKILNEEQQRRLTAIQQKESAIEMQVKALETTIEEQKQMLEADEDALKDGIERATPKLSGLG